MIQMARTVGVFMAVFAVQATAWAKPRAEPEVPSGLRSHLVSCTVVPDTERPNCPRIQAMILTDFTKAMAGDYQGQRNTAVYFRDGGAALSVSGRTPFLFPNPIQSCAWRMVILDSGHAEINQVDTNNLRISCNDLGEVERSAARVRSQQIMKEIRARRR